MIITKINAILFMIYLILIIINQLKHMKGNK